MKVRMKSKKTLSLKAIANGVVFAFCLPALAQQALSNPVPFTVDQVKSQAPPTQLIKQAKDLAAHGEYEGAMQKYNDIIHKHPQAPAAYIGRAKVYLELGKSDLALKDFDSAVKYDPKMNNWALRDRGNLLQKYHRYEDAIKDFDKMLEKHPDSSMQADRATCYMRLKKYPQAIEGFTRSLNLHVSKRTHTIAKRGDCYLALGQYQKALADYDQILKEDPDGNRSQDNYAKVREGRAQCYEKLGKPELAKKERTLAAQARNELLDLAPFTSEKKR